MKIIGVDLSGPRNIAETCAVVFDAQADELRFVDVVHGAGDQQIFDLVSRLPRNERLVIGMDAPLSYQPGGGDRASDAELRRLVNGKVGVMPPTFMRMVYLTLRGISLARMLEILQPGRDIQIVEIHPGASMLLRGASSEALAGQKKHPAARLSLLAWLTSQGLSDLPDMEAPSDHYVSACGAALGAWHWALGKPKWIHPAELPLHPYDFAC